jgi:integrase
VKATEPTAWWADFGGRSPTLDQYLERWLELCLQRGLRATTVASYRATVLRRTGELGSSELSAIRAADLDVFYAHLLRAGRVYGKGGLSARSVRYLHAILNRALSDAVRAGVLEHNPAQAANPPSSRAARPRVYPTWTSSELATFLATARGTVLYPAFRLGAMAGLRRSEILGARWLDVDVGGANLHVVQGIVEVDHVPTVSSLKSESSRRAVALDEETLAVLVAHRLEQVERHPRLPANALLFAKEDGSPLHPSLFSYFFQQAVKQAGVPRIRLHDVRHTHATLALQAGVHPKVISERLGHASIGITLDLYSHVLPSLQREAADAVAALVAG